MTQDELTAQILDLIVRYENEHVEKVDGIDIEHTMNAGISWVSIELHTTNCTHAKSGTVKT